MIYYTSRIIAGLICTTLSLVISASGTFAQNDPLPSWNDGPLKQKIIRFVTSAVSPGEGYVKEPERIAMFDNDGTLWCEQPTVEAEFAKSRLMGKAKTDAALRETIARVSAAMKNGKSADVQRDILSLLAASHSGLSEEEFADAVRVWLSTARHPKSGRPFTEMHYQPMQELLTYLRENKFQIFLCSGGTLEFMRVFAPALYRIPRQNIIGSSINLETRYNNNGETDVYRKPGIARINDKDGKPVGIELHLGIRPAFVGGNVRSGGDIAMMRYSQGRPSASLQILVNHDDAEREFAYAEKDNFSLNAATKYGFTVISMKRDWKQIFPK
jgi:hypothetical protein